MAKKRKKAAKRTTKKAKVSKARKVVAKSKTKAKTKRKAAKKSTRKRTFGQRVAGALGVVTGTIRDTNALRDKLEPPATSETE